MSNTPAVASATVLELRDVQLRFGRTEILRGVGMALRAGERVALIGPNGAGKSTLFNLISGALVPDAGRITLHGRRIDGLAPHRVARLGLARSFQVSQLFGQLDVAANLRCAVLGARRQRYAFWRRLGPFREGREVGEVEVRVEWLLEQTGLTARRDTPAQHLSYAEQRALEIGLTLAGDARLILLDEPTAGMNQSETRRCIELIRRVSNGRTLLMVEHDMGVVFDLADRIAVLAGGELIAFDTPAAVRADARVQQAYLGALAESTRSAGADRC